MKSPVDGYGQISEKCQKFVTVVFIWSQAIFITPFVGYKLYNIKY